MDTAVGVQVQDRDRSLALWSSTAAFTVCFAAWTIFSILGVQIKRDLALNDFQFGLLVGTPILTGSLIRLALGIWADQYGGRVVFTATMLCAAVATWLLSYAYDFTTFLLAALGVGIAGGSFSVGVAYVSKWFPKEKQGTALGIFGAGNVGSAVTKFLGPVVMVTLGWHAVAQIWALGLAVTAVLFFVVTKDDPDLAARRARGVQPESFAQMLAPLANLQVWRFSLYYFFVFGGFVALALWLPRYYVGVYGLDIVTAGMLGAAYSIPGSLFRVLGGTLSDKYGARAVMYWTFLGAVVCTFLLSYPATSYVVQGIRGPIAFDITLGFVPFMLLTMVLGFFMSLGKAAVYKHSAAKSSMPVPLPADTRSRARGRACSARQLAPGVASRLVVGEQRVAMRRPSVGFVAPAVELDPAQYCRRAGSCAHSIRRGPVGRMPMRLVGRASSA